MKKNKRAQIKFVFVAICIVLFTGSSLAMLTNTSTLEGLKGDHVFSSRIEHSDKSVDETKFSGWIRRTVDLAHAVIDKKVEDALAQRIDGAHY